MGAASLPSSEDLKPDTRLNFLILAASGSSAAALLWVSARMLQNGNTALAIASAVAFSFVNNTLFSLMHEAVHRSFSATPRWNELGGRLASLFFPTGLGFQRVCHLGHHLRNRTDHEIFDMYYEDDNKILKYLQFYCIITGIFWLSIPFACALFLLWPGAYRMGRSKAKWMKATDAVMFLPLVEHPRRGVLRLEIALSFAFQLLLARALGLSWASWGLCYGLFALNWGSLQYADHAWAKRDIREGAWNLHVNPLTRAIFLNYHLHLVHHRHPNLPWNRLNHFVDPQEPMPAFWKIYLQMWKGPRPVDAPPPRALATEFAETLK